MSSQHFLRHILRINNKKHDNFMDEYLTYQKVKTFSQSTKKECNDCRQAFLQISLLAINFPFSHSIKDYFNATF